VPRQGKPNAQNRQTRVRRNHRLPVAAVAEPANFYPFGISGLVAWYDFSDPTMLYTDTTRNTKVSADGDTIKAVRDQSPAGNHLSEATNGPAYKVNIQNGRSVGRFNGTSSVLRFTPATSLTDWTVFVALKWIAMSAYGGPMFWGKDTATVAAGFHLTLNAVNAGVNIVETDGAGVEAARKQPDATVSNGVAYLIAADSNGATQRIFQNGVQNDNAAGVTGFPIGTGGIVLGRVDDFPSGWFNGDMFEVLVYNSVLSDSNRTVVSKYLGQKWNVSVT